MKQQDQMPKRQPFNILEAVSDEQSYFIPAPNCAKTVIAPGMDGGHFVPVSFVAKDWSVTPRRIRALLAEGRLKGRLLANGYWEVRFPYLFTFGTRGPDLKRQKRQKKRSNNVVLIAE